LLSSQRNKVERPAPPIVRRVGRPATPLRLSPREARLVSFLDPKNYWIASEELALKEFAGRIPLNGRTCITVAMRQAARKMKRNKEERFFIEKRGGGRGGCEYRLVRKRA